MQIYSHINSTTLIKMYIVYNFEDYKWLAVFEDKESAFKGAIEFWNTYFSYCDIPTRETAMDMLEKHGVYPYVPDDDVGPMYVRELEPGAFCRDW